MEERKFRPPFYFIIQGRTVDGDGEVLFLEETSDTTLLSFTTFSGLKYKYKYTTADISPPQKIKNDRM